MTTDLVVVVPGITGSALADANGREIWGLSAGSLLRALTGLGASIRALELPPDIGDRPASDGVVATSLIHGLHGIPGVWTPIHGYGGLERFLAASRFGLTAENLVLFAYDWRLSNRWTAELLKRRVSETLERWRASAPERADAKVIFICHSMGGLVVRWYLDMLGGAEIARALVTLGTPHRGAAKTVGELVNGVRKARIDLSAFARSMPSSYQLLPEYACIDGVGSELLKTTETALPGLDPSRVADAMAFHDDLDAADDVPYPLISIVGIGQPTCTTVLVDSDRVVPQLTIGDEDRGGDGTVPRLAARPKRIEDERDPTLRGIGEGHGALAAHRALLDQIDFVLTAETRRYRGVDEERVLGVDVPDFHAAGEELVVRVTAPERRLLEAVAIDEAGAEVLRDRVRFQDEDGALAGAANLGVPDPGGYTVVVRVPDDPGGRELPPVHATTMVW